MMITMKDIMIQLDDYGYWDINFINEDLSLTQDNNTIKNGVILSILTIQDELKTPTYENFGCRLHDLKKSNDNDLRQSKSKAYIIESLEKMKRVRSVDNILFKDNLTKIYLTLENNVKLSTVMEM